MDDSHSTQPHWLLNYDQYLYVNVPEKKKHDKNAFSTFVDQAKHILARGWDERVENFEIYNAGVGPDSKKQRALIAVKLTADWNKPMTRGPEANTPEAVKFREFYGDKSQMRKLLDGSIREAVVWYDENEKEEQRNYILAKIANFLLTKHYAECHVQVRQFKWHKLVTSYSEYNKIAIAFDRLATAIRNIKGFPLGVSTVYCTSPFFRRTEPFPPLGRFLFEKSKASKIMDDNVARIALGLTEDDQSADSVPYFTPALTVLLTMEQSNKFGDTPEIIAKFKTAFYIELSNRLKSDHGIFAVPTETKFYATVDDIAFEVEIGQFKEITIARKLEQEKKKALIPHGGDWKSLKHKIEHLPQMSNQINGLSYRFPAYAETCQLFKRFLASHFLLEHFDEIATELIVGNVFLKLECERGTPPLDPFSGFTHVLNLLSSHDFVKQPLFIDFNGNYETEQKEKALTYFVNARPVLPPLVLFTNDDDTGIRFTKRGPELAIFSRLIELSSCALLVIKKHLEGTFDAELKSIFFSEMDDYDVIIQLKTSVVHHGSHEYETGKKLAATLKPRRNRDLLPVVNFNPPMKLLEDLRKYFGKFALFFYNRYGGKAIGVIFKPDFKAKVGEFNVNRKDIKKGLTPNVADFLETVKIMGDGIVEDINVKAE